MKIIACFDNDMWCDVSGTSLCFITDEDYNKLVSGEITTGDLVPMGEVVLQGNTFNKP